jgi:phage/plasmid-like protein (TIGR03299 family)
MAHEIAKTDGRDAMMYVGEPPWHGLGRELAEAPTAAEAIAQAGLDYEVLQLPTFAAGPHGSVPMPDLFLNVRSDTLDILGRVSDKYKAVQNREAFDFLDSVVREGEVRYETAGALGVGERIWMLGRLPGHIRVRGTDDVSNKYLLLYNSHDGSSALRVLFTIVRVVCANTARAALADVDAGISIRHAGDLDKKVEEARRTLGLASDYFTAFGEGADFLAGFRPGRGHLEAYFRSLYPDPKAGDPGRARSTRASLFGLFETGMGADMPGIKGTAWAAYHAVTEHVDHHVGTDRKRRLESAWFGDGSKLKSKAFDLAIAMVEGKLEPVGPAAASLAVDEPRIIIYAPSAN